MQYNNPFISNDFEISSYYFYSDFQNNHIIVPLFVKPTINSIVTHIGNVFNQILYFLKNIYLLFTFESIDGDIYFTKIKNIILDVSSNITNITNIANIANIANISRNIYPYSFNKILLGVICIYWIITLLKDTFYAREQRIHERIAELEKKVSLLNQKHQHLENEMKQIFCLSSNIK